MKLKGNLIRIFFYIIHLGGLLFLFYLYDKLHWTLLVLYALLYIGLFYLSQKYLNKKYPPLIILKNELLDQSLFLGIWMFLFFIGKDAIQVGTITWKILVSGLIGGIVATGVYALVGLITGKKKLKNNNDNK